MKVHFEVSHLVQNFGNSIAGLSIFFLSSSALIPPLVLCWHLIWSWRPDYGALGCHPCWALGSQRAFFGAVVCVLDLGASQGLLRCC